jgi:nucleotide-binding universal stress UspA family protein
MASVLILHPSDPTAASRAALRVALNLVAELPARLLVLGAVPPFSWSNRVTYGNQPDEPGTSLRRLEGELRDRVRAAGGEGAERLASYLTVVDDLAPAAVRVAADRRSDLVVMGYPGAGGWWGRLFRPAPERVAADAPCPVLLVRDGAVRAFPPPARAA